MTDHDVDSDRINGVREVATRPVSAKIQLRDGTRVVCEAERASEVMRAASRVAHGATIAIPGGELTWLSDLEAWLFTADGPEAA